MSWIHTLKFKIVALAVATGVLSTVGTAELLINTTRSDIQKLLLQNGASNRQATAALLASKLDILQEAVSAIARASPTALWQDRAALQRRLQQETAANALFDVVFASDASGKVVVRLADGIPSAGLPDIADRPYFQQAIRSDQVVVSDPLVSRSSNQPSVILAMAVLLPNGKPVGLVGGSLELDSARLFSNIGGGDLRDGSRTLVMNRAGVVIAHSDPTRLLGKASDEPGLGEVYARWRDSGSPIDTDGSASLSSGHLISMAGIAISDWVLVRITPQSIALQPLHAAQRTAWLSAAALGSLAAILAAWYGLRVTRPIDQLRDRAMASLSDTRANLAPWPDQWRGELGELARVFQHVDDERERRHDETNALLQQLEAVLNHAEIGIAMSRNGKFELVSRRFCETFGMTAAEMEGQSTRIIYGSDEAYDALSARARPQFMEQGYFAGEVELMRKSEGLFWAFMRGRAVVPGDLSKGTIWTFDDVTESRAHREKLTWVSSHDALTGLANRTAFEALLTEATANAASAPFCVLFLDLDKFKQVNDTSGHAAGDAVLRNIAQRLASQVRKSDTVARLGGDEFAVLLPQCPSSQARDVAEKMRQAVVDYRLVWEGHTFAVGASIGMVRVDGTFSDTQEVMAAADSACYAAKHQGRNRVVAFGD